MKKFTVEKIYTIKMELNLPKGKVEKLSFTKETIVIGRGSQCDVVVVSDGLSRRHLLIEREEDKIFLTDLGSSNGTFVGDEKLSPSVRTEYNTFFMAIKIGIDVTLTMQVEVGH